MKLLGKAAGHDSDHARMPAPVGEHKGWIGFRVEPLAGLFRGGQEDAALLRLALGVELVQIVREARGPGLVGGRQEFDAAGRLAEPARSVEPRREPEGHVFALELRFFVELGERQQPGDPRAAPLLQALETVLDIDPVFIEQRHDVGHRAEGREAHPFEQHFAEAGRDLLRAAGPRRDRPGELERHAGAAQLAEGIGRARKSRVDEHGGLGERVGEGVVVGDHEFEPEIAGMPGLGDACDAAVDRHDEARALACERGEGLRVEAVAFFEPVGHVPGGIGIERVEALDQDRRRTHAVGVVVAVDDDLPARPCRREDPVGRLSHAGQEIRVAQVGHRARQEGFDVARAGEPAGREQPRHDRRHARRSLEPGDERLIVGLNVPALGHRPTPCETSREYRGSAGRDGWYSAGPAGLRVSSSLEVTDVGR